MYSRLTFDNNELRFNFEEIPMFHLVNASITFHNIFATEEPVRGVQTLTEENGRLACILDEELFEPPPLYDIRMSVTPAPISSSDDDIFRWTMDDDLSGEAASRGDHSKMVDIYEALNVPRTTLKDVTPDSDTEEQLLQRYFYFPFLSNQSINY